MVIHIRRSIQERSSIQSPQHHSLFTSPSPSRSGRDKLPLLIKGKMAFNVNKKFYFKTGRHTNTTRGYMITSVAETDKGLVRDYNEDKISMVHDATNPAFPVHFFGLYDGHGGSRCAEFLKQNLHDYILKDSDLHVDPKNVILRSFIKAENMFIEDAKRNNLDRSGSCGIICLVIKDKCYVANLGDSRAVLSSNKGSKIFPLSRDHKPFEQLEMSRIIQAGGYVYQSNNYNSVPAVLGPYRVFPGRLSVSRTIGDIYAKLSQYGGNANVIIPTPEIKNFRILPEHDFILMCSDGIFDRIDNNKAIECIWESFRENYTLSIEHKCSNAAKKLIQLAFERNSMDNVTVIIIALTNLQDN
ncbi:hypothetical protein SteCoe_35290 [Stentor coeruleus]|uniref:PPM-type phosphatase domain-containing protein n=1 Tax=Stentor coeruleus TaxID=5963 RepID=A0A1R2ASQ0_9CILI|nr:hypothetical protein SteCoe_35290 [Stentor coeruleus]